MDTYSEKMLAALHDEDLAQAQLFLTQALKQDEPDVLAELGEELLALGFLEDAQQIFLQLKAAYPEEDSLNLSLAEIAIENNQTDEALMYLEDITKDSENYVASLLITADLYQVLGIPEVSEAKLNEAQQLLPEEPLIAFALAELYFSIQQHQRAITGYQQLQTSGFDTVSGVSLNERLGASYDYLGEFEQAIPFLEAAMEEQATDDRMFQLAFTYFQLEEFQKAIALFQQLRVINPHYQALYYYLAQALQQEEQWETAKEVLTAGLEENPYQVDLYHLASENAYRLHDVQAAEEFLRKAVELGDKPDESLLTLSNLYLSEGRYDEVIETIQKMEDVEHPYAFWNLAHAYNAREEFALAQINYEKAYEELNHEPEFLKEYGLFLREEGRLEQAITVLNHYLTLEPLDTDVQSLMEDISESRW